jgi:[glutamine synthetase] adenylyltransferase / [glutamine synthetase]-adenylyl-L-tyrosine phosphorylase
MATEPTPRLVSSARVLSAWLRLAPDPEAAARRLEHLAAAGLRDADLESEDAREVVKIAVGPAPYLAALAARDPSRLLAAAKDPYLRREKPLSRLRVELGERLAGATQADFLARLRAFRAQEFIRLGARECGLGHPTEVARELAHLAEAAFDAAVRFYEPICDEQLGVPSYTTDDGTVRRPGFTVIGMGKLGGEELNFSSDVDVIYVYSSDNGETTRGRSLHEYFDRLARKVTPAIGEITEDGLVFRVDHRLRPEGSRGPLVNSLPSLERYYESWGRPWERQAWLKARPSGGSAELGAEVLAVLEPFIFPRNLGPEVIRDVEELNRRIKTELDGGTLESGFDVKIGVGGIREIEFFVQALQLVHAGKNPGLRVRGTRAALDRLLFAGIIAERERRALSDAYDFLRQVEHRLQLESGQQTQRLPRDPEALDVLARRLGFGGLGELRGTLELHTREVAAIFATLGAVRQSRPEIAAVLDPRREAELESMLGRLGFRDPENAAFLVELARKRPGSPFHAAASGSAARLAPLLLEELVASPDPGQALSFFVDFLSAVGAAASLTWQAFLDNPRLLRLVASLFGTSAFLAKTFVRHPELVDAVLLDRRAPRDLHGEAQWRVDSAQARAEMPELQEEAAWNALRRFRHEEVLRIGLADIAGELDAAAVTRALSGLADVCLAETLRTTLGHRARKKQPSPPMTILALGKLGAEELGYASDLDLVFLYEGGVEDHEAATKVAQRLVRALATNLEEGRLYEVDTRLRPSGNQGTLVSSLAAWRQYHAGEAQLWERQALIRARAAAGDHALGQMVEREIVAIVWGRPPGDRRAIAAEIAAMRERVERELGGPRDLKAGRGGLLDIEFAAQYLQLAHGHEHPRLRVRGTAAALGAAAAAGLISEELRARLVDGLAFLRRLENRLRIVHDRPIHELPEDPAELEPLARRSGWASGQMVRRAYTEWTRLVRAGYEEIVLRST